MPGLEFGDDVPARSLTRVEFFRREPGGGTLFLKPSEEQTIADPVDVADLPIG